MNQDKLLLTSKQAYIDKEDIRLAIDSISDFYKAILHTTCTITIHNLETAVDDTEVRVELHTSSPAGPHKTTKSLQSALELAIIFNKLSLLPSSTKNERARMLSEIKKTTQVVLVYPNPFLIKIEPFLCKIEWVLELWECDL